MNREEQEKAIAAQLKRVIHLAAGGRDIEGAAANLAALIVRPFQERIEELEAKIEQLEVLTARLRNDDY